MRDYPIVEFKMVLRQPVIIDLYIISDKVIYSLIIFLSKENYTVGTIF